MFLIRLAFWVGVVVLLLPADERQQARLYGTAVSAVERASTFCERHEKICAGGAELWASFLKKAEFGARMAVDLVTNSARRGEDVQPAVLPSGPQPATVQPAAVRGRSAQAAAQGTLSAADLTPVWRGSARTGG